MGAAALAVLAVSQLAACGGSTAADGTPWSRRRAGTGRAPLTAAATERLPVPHPLPPSPPPVRGGATGAADGRSRSPGRLPPPGLTPRPSWDANRIILRQHAEGSRN
ncbi:exported hypothetical protein [Parafrankia sp. Ea1.12]|nr:exported hypothetical protein [Parafrankia sp. Ea1.12]